ncbi:hypothetical protein C2869_14230 [Saccharobesus litoralis]|uniref:Uncharacterized protein n=1 Tax=Saccharobesus litoralis TaxID=2172099 RepID=A0A2S0VTI0_9ALTE|nr:hypothetical protein [Saccharobesus litoralis]AWB67526.1 hypothetical protein C2869_14230 [Saccharobesus litoralis]
MSDKTNNELFKLVELIRLVNNFDSTDSNKYLAKDVLINENIWALIEDVFGLLCVDQNSSELEVFNDDAQIYKTDGKARLTRLKPKFLGKKANLKINSRANCNNRIYTNVNEMLDVFKNLPKKNWPEFYYLHEENYCSGKDDFSKKPDKIRKIEELLDFVEKLKKIAFKFDERNDTPVVTFYSNDKEDKGDSKLVDIKLTIDAETITLPLNNYAILDAAIGSGESDSAFENEKSMLLKAAICEEFSKKKKSENDLHFLINHWKDIDLTYHVNLELFITGLSFSKLKQEVEESTLKYLDNVNSSLVDISLKLTTVPASFGVWVYIFRKDHSTIQMWGFFAALAMLTLIMHFALDGHSAKLQHVKGSITKQFGLLKEKLLRADENKNAKEKIKAEIKISEDFLDKRANKVGLYLWACKSILWIPLLIVLIVNCCNAFAKENPINDKSINCPFKYTQTSIPTESTE